MISEVQYFYMDVVAESNENAKVEARKKLAAGEEPSADNEAYEGYVINGAFPILKEKAEL